MTDRVIERMPWYKAERQERKEVVQATLKTWVNCAGCGREFRHFGLLCARCRFKPSTPTRGDIHGKG